MGRRYALKIVVAAAAPAAVWDRRRRFPPVGSASRNPPPTLWRCRSPVRTLRTLLFNLIVVRERYCYCTNRGVENMRPWRPGRRADSSPA